MPHLSHELIHSDELDGHFNSIDQLTAENAGLKAKLAAEAARHKKTKEDLRKQRQVTDVIKQLLNDKQRRSICVDSLLGGAASADLSGSDDDDAGGYDENGADADTSAAWMATGGASPSSSRARRRGILKDTPLQQVALAQGSDAAALAHQHSSPYHTHALSDSSNRSNLARRSSSRLAAMSNSNGGSTGGKKAPHAATAKQYYPDISAAAAAQEDDEEKENNYVEIDAYKMNQHMQQHQQQHHHTPAGSHAGTPVGTPIPSAPSEPFSLYARSSANGAGNAGALAAAHPAMSTPLKGGGGGSKGTPKKSGKKRKQKNAEIASRQRRHMLKESTVLTRSRCAKCMNNIGSRVKHNQCTQCSRRYHEQCALAIPCDCRPPAFGGKQSRDAPPIGSNLQAVVEDPQMNDDAAPGLNVPSIVNDVIAAVDRRG